MADNRAARADRATRSSCAQQYLSIEQLRLGDRLRVDWRHRRTCRRDALIPPLVLQPLLENAVYHGIEPRSEPGAISIDDQPRATQVHLALRNPYRPDGSHHAGNRMALANIRERLRCTSTRKPACETSSDATDAYQVHIVMPYLKARHG